MDNDRVFADYIKGTTICAVKKDGRIAVNASHLDR